jgi:type I restriction-modification system DNA methylase subunit
MRFKNHGLAPKSAADFAFLLHGFHYLKDEGVMAIILPHGVLFIGETMGRPSLLTVEIPAAGGIVVRGTAVPIEAE